MALHITLATYTFPHQVLVDRSKLEAFGIACTVKDGLTIQVHNFYSNALGGIKLQVHPKDYERAREVLSDHPDISAEYPDAKLKCPRCASGNVDGVGLNGKIALIILMVTGLPIPVFSKKYHCFECHEEFKLPNG
ncbi:hypothetical protein [Maribacter sp. 2307ULW6-5]|uniref:hypothetical protein n=1 Tax=Maribacter sp. 2307ULW6-5 TaxID=3386275 RepID=UPI0039BD715D